MEDLLESHLVPIFKCLPLLDLVYGCSQVCRAWHQALSRRGGELLLACAGIVAVPLPDDTMSWPRAMALAVAAKYVPLHEHTWAVEPHVLTATLKDPLKLLKFELPHCDVSAGDLFTILSQVPECTTSPVLAQLALRAIAEGDYTGFLRMATEFFHKKDTKGHAYYDAEYGLIPSACSGPDGVPWGHWSMYFGRRGFTDVTCIQPQTVWSLPLLLCPDEEMLIGYIQSAVASSLERQGRPARQLLPVNHGLIEPLLQVTDPAFVHAVLAHSGNTPPPPILTRLGLVSDLLQPMRGNVKDWALLDGSMKVATMIVERALFAGDKHADYEEKRFPLLADEVEDEDGAA